MRRNFLSVLVLVTNNQIDVNLRNNLKSVISDTVGCMEVIHFIFLSCKPTRDDIQKPGHKASESTVKITITN